MTNAQMKRAALIVQKEWARITDKNTPIHNATVALLRGSDVVGTTSDRDFICDRLAALHFLARMGRRFRARRAHEISNPTTDAYRGQTQALLAKCRTVAEFVGINLDVNEDPRGPCFRLVNGPCSWVLG